MLIATAAYAQSPYPNCPIKFVMAYPPAGSSDVLARPIANEMSKGLDQPALLEYKPGAGSERRQLGQRLRARCAAGRDRHESPIPDARERGRDRRQP